MHSGVRAIRNESVPTLASPTRHAASVRFYYRVLERFKVISHGIFLYKSSYDQTYFVTRFLCGLKEEIRSAIALHQPADVSTASTLALLQEEELENARRRNPPREFGKSSFKASSGDKSKNPRQAVYSQAST